MTQLLFRCLPTLSPPISSSASPSPTIFLSFKPISSYQRIKPISAKVPARDRIIDFGKYKGKMLGTLPSKYLKWVSKNLRARDFEEWAKLADEVLQDPVYRDRLEWEFAEKILNGDESRASRTESPVSDLLEISERFGWDNEDKAAWNRLDFGLIGTSKGGRIPKVGVSEGGKSVLRGERELGFSKMGKLGSFEEDLVLKRERKVGFLQEESRARADEEMGSLEKGLGLRRERKIGYLSRDSVVSRIQEAGPLKKDAGLESQRKLGSLDRNSRFSRIEEMGSLETNSESRKVAPVGYLREESRASEPRMDDFDGRKVRFLSKGVSFYDVNEEEGFEEEIVRGKREVRRERQRFNRGMQMQKLKKEVGVKEDRGDRNGIQKQNHRGTSNPFPGREALLRKANRQD
ncbi:uncharacterized protein LOC131240537 [Magnolia sinica]|uniref:uncharacterized protein LOC131240537 n=1 Tax=Magnolia sinica TaxID=86752 RepID=UPI002659D681|nr:uncharacterized protein LOC131240537 [Magnolia sinica]